MKCVNCGDEIDRPHVWQGVTICENCFKIVSHVIKKTKEEMQQVFLLYTDMLRVALVKGELRPPVLPKGKQMPQDVFRDALKGVAEKLGARDGTQTKPSNGNGRVPVVRDEAQGDDADGLSDRVRDDTLSGRR